MAVHTPGHTEAHHSLVDESSGVAVVDEALFGSDARGLPAGYFVLPTAYYSTDLATAGKSLSRLTECDFTIGLVYHGSSVTEDASGKLARELLAQYNRTTFEEPDQRRDLLESLFDAFGADSRVEPPFRCGYRFNIGVSEGVYANYGCVVLDVCPVTIGQGCLLGPGVHLYTATHPLDPETRAAGLESGDPIEIGENVWIGGRAVVTPGVTIGDDAVVGAGSVVTRDVPAGTLVGGNPARVLQELT